MPQLTAFPYLPEGDDSAGVSALVAVCRELPAAGEPMRDFRRRMRSYRLWDRQRGPDTLAFLGVESGDRVAPSPLMKKLSEAKGERAKDLLAERLWEANPILFKTVIERVAERVHPPKELFSTIDSHGYRGRRVSWPSFEAWLRLARGLGVLKTLGIAIGLDERGERFLARARELDIEDFLEEEAEESAAAAEPASAPETDEEPDPAGTPAPIPTPAAAVPSRPVRAAPGVEPASHPFSLPVGRERPVPVSSFAGSGETFPEEVLDETRRRIESWWSEQSPGERPLSIEDFGLGADKWMESAEETLYRAAVAAALVFRLGRGRAEVIAAFRGLEEDGVLDDLYYGTAPEVLSERVDPQALMLASLVARRSAEVPDLAVSLEKQASAAEAFSTLDRALGRGLFKVELFWIMRQLERLGALRMDDLADYTAVPHRAVRDALFRLGFVATPYAHEARDLVPAAAAARRAAGEAAIADEVLAAFALAAGCAYDCSRRRSCEHACRERL